LSTHSDIEHIETDELWTLLGMVTQPQPPWGLNAISHRGLGDEDKGYTYDSSAGKGTYAYIIDSGIDAEHIEFENRATLGFNVFQSKPPIDKMGHGTHVAGIIGSKTFGVAKRCNLIGVKVSHCFATYNSAILKGVSWAVQDILAKKRKHKSVINISMGGLKSTAFNRAVEAAVNAGVVTVVAAGNARMPVSWSSPGSAKGAIVVGATGKAYKRAWFSNYGKNVTLFAPGVHVPSTWIGGQHDRNKTLSGTSAAAPHVAGIALYLQAMCKIEDINALRATLVKLATAKVVSDAKGSPNLFAYNGGGSFCSMVIGDGT
ncbi:subtilisin-like protein, partial [Myriangium duriaei CBS 260.36]